VHTPPHGGLPHQPQTQSFENVLAFFFTNAGNFHNYVNSTANGRVKVYVKDKSKVVPFHATKTEVLHSFFIWALHGGEW